MPVSATLDRMKILTKLATALLALGAAGGCADQKYLPDQYSFEVFQGASKRYDFGVNMHHQKYEELGGSIKSPGLNAIVRKELDSKGLCPNGYTLYDNGSARGGYRSIAGKCKAA